MLCIRITEWYYVLIGSDHGKLKFYLVKWFYNEAFRCIVGGSKAVCGLLFWFSFQFLTNKKQGELFAALQKLKEG